MPSAGRSGGQCSRALGRADRRLRGRTGYVDRYFPADYTIIPNGVDTGIFHPDLEPLPGCRGPGPSILSVGRLEERKGFIHLLRAFGEVIGARPDARLLVAGAYGARERNRYAALAARLRIRNISFLGPQARPELARCYASADVFCAPSTGGRELRHCVAALLRLLADNSLRRRLGRAGVRRAAEFDWAVVSRRVAAFYLAALDRNGRVPHNARAQAGRAGEGAPLW